MSEELVTFFKALADKNRLKIVGLLAEKSYSVEELATLLGLKPPTVSHHLAKLVDVGLVSRESNPDDRRSSFAALTVTGRERFREVAKVYVPAIEREVGRIDDAALAKVADGLRALLAAAEAPLRP